MRNDVKIVSEYKRLFGIREGFNITEENIKNGFLCKDEWVDPLSKLFSRIQQEVNDNHLHFRIVQIKNVKDTLKIYTYGANEEILDQIRYFEYSI